MKRQVWIPLALSVVAAYLILDRRAARYAAGYDDLEAAAIRTADWGSRQRITGIGRRLLGRLKEKLGQLTGDEDLAERGVMDQIAGAAQDTSGRAAHVVSDAIHDLNRY